MDYGFAIRVTANSISLTFSWSLKVDSERCCVYLLRDLLDLGPSCLHSCLFSSVPILCTLLPKGNNHSRYNPLYDGVNPLRPDGLLRNSRNGCPDANLFRIIGSSALCLERPCKIMRTYLFFAIHPILFGV